MRYWNFPMGPIAGPHPTDCFSILAINDLRVIETMSTLEERIANLTPEKRQRFLEQIKKQERASGQVLRSSAIPRIDRTAESLPLSFGQQRLWFLDQFEPDNSAYNIPAAYLLEGEINLLAL